MEILLPPNFAPVSLDEKRSRIFYAKSDLPQTFSNTWRTEKIKEAERQEETLRQQFSTISSNTLMEVRPVLNAGTFHSLFVATFVDGSKVVIRTSPASQETAISFLIDAGLATFLRTIPVPQLLKVDLSRQTIPFDYELMSVAGGLRLTEFEDAQTQEMEPELLRTFGRVVAALHATLATGAGLLSIARLAAKPVELQGVLASWGDYIHLRLDDHLALCREISAISSAEARLIEDIFQQGRKNLNKAPVRLLHGDLGHHNVFVENKKISAILDWEDAMAGDPIFDVAYWGTFVREHMREHFLAGYYADRHAPDDFEYRYWLYYLRIALSKTVHRHHFGAKERPGRPPASSRIQKALSHLQALGWK